MNTSKPQARNAVVYRILLITVMFVNALAPTGAAALSPANTEGADLPSASAIGSKGRIGAAVKLFAFLPSRTTLQNTTPTVSATSIETPTPGPSTTPGSEATPTPMETLVPAATLESTPTPSVTQTATQTSTVIGEPPVLSFKFSVTPEQAAPGDEVTFTFEVVNNGQAPATGLLFANILPQEFGTGQSGFKDFDFNPQTRLLTWNGAQAGVPTLTPGQKVSLSYTVRIDAQLDEVQLVDSATFEADGFSEPLLAEATLSLLSPKKRLTMLGLQGGKAVGLNGRIEVNVPANAVDSPRGVLIQDLNEGLSPTSPEEVWLKFALEMRVPKPENAQPLQEQDRIIPLETIEAQFDQPVKIAISFDGLADLAAIGAEFTPFLATLDEASGTWVRMPLETIDRKANRIAAEVTHFSIWGTGLGAPFPGANILLFDSEYSDLFTGRARYSIPIWVPSGRNGMAPSLALSYSSGTIDGIFGDVQASWVGMGWNIDTVEIARKITNTECNPCGNGPYGYENKFLLLFNGTGYPLLPDGTTPGRYHTTSESFMYIQLHNNNLGNNSPAAQNTTSEWWEVVQKDGTRWRLGWTSGSEQLAAMNGYPGAATGTWAALGYAGSATNVVTSRWRADQVTDTHGNRMTFTYFEEGQPVNGTGANYDRASYLDTIAYTSHTSGSPAAGYSVVFVRETRTGGDGSASQTDPLNWDTYRLDRIEVKYGANVVRTYDLGYEVRSYTGPDGPWDITILTSVAVSGGANSLPTMLFSYVNLNNRAECGAECEEWAYPRLATVANGWGGIANFAYENDGRPSTSWYNWRVTTLDVADGVNASPMKTTFAYSTPCYNDSTAGWCNTSNTGELIGYGQTRATTKDFDGTTTLAIAVHKFHTTEQLKVGREYEVQRQLPDGTILSKTTTDYTVVTAGLPTGGYFTYASRVDEFLRTTSLVQINRTEYVYSSTTGNLTTQKDFNSALALFRQTDYQYVTNTAPAVWILDKVSRRILKDVNLAVVSTQEYGYDGSLPASG